MSNRISFFSLPEGRREAIKVAIRKMSTTLDGVEGDLSSITMRYKGDTIVIPNVDTILLIDSSTKVYAVDMGRFGETNKLGYTYDSKLIELTHARLADGHMYGEYGFPSARTLDRVMEVNLGSVSHEVLDAAEVDGRFILYVKLMPNHGMEIDGKDMSFGMRALTKVSNGEGGLIMDIQNIVTWDYIGTNTSSV